MLVPRAIYDSLSKDFLVGSQQVLANLLARCDERVRQEVRSGQQWDGAIQSHGSSYLRKQQVGDDGRDYM